MRISRHRIWIRVAGNATAIKEGKSHGWRLYINACEPEIPLRDWRVTGTVERNFRPQIDTKGERPLGLSAWIDLHGDLEIDEQDVAHIALRPVSTTDQGT